MLHDSFVIDFRIVDDRDQAVDHFAEIVRWNLGRHADGDALGTIDQQVRKLAGEHQRLLERIVVVGAEVDRFLVDVVEQLLGQAIHADLRITHRCC